MGNYILHYQQWLEKQKSDPNRLPEDVMQDFVNDLAKESDYLLDGYIDSKFGEQGKWLSSDWILVLETKHNNTFTLMRLESQTDQDYPVKIILNLSNGLSQEMASVNNAQELSDKIDNLLQDNKVKETLFRLLRRIQGD